MKKGHKIKSLLAGILAAVLILQAPFGYVVQAQDPIVETGSGEPAESQRDVTAEEAEETPPVEEIQETQEIQEGTQSGERRAPMDWSGKTDSVKISLGKITAGEMSAAVSEDRENFFDASGLEYGAAMNFEVGFELTGVPEDEQILAGDTMVMSVLEEQMKLRNTTEPKPLYSVNKVEYQNAGMDAAKGEEIGTYTVAENVLTVVLGEAAQEQTSFFGVVSFEAELAEGVMEEELNVTLQPDHHVTILLPKQPEEQPVITDPETVDQAGRENEIQEEPAKQPDISESSEAEDQEDTASGEISKEEQNTEAPEEKEENSAGTKLRSLFQRVVSAVGGDAKSVDDKYFENALKSKHTFSGSELPDGFDIVKLTVLSKAGGYEKNEKDAYVRMAYDVFMDEDFLFAKSEEFMEETSFPKQGSQTEKKWLEKVKIWLDSQDESLVPPLVYTYDLGELFAGYSCEETILHNAANDTGEIGRYVITDGQLKVTMNSLLYFMNDISFTFNFDAELDTSGFGDDPQEIVIGDDGKLIHQSEGTAGGDSGETGTPDYVLDKEAPVKVSDTTITYHLTASAKDKKYLNGRILTDVMPQVTADGKNYKLKVVSLTRKGTSGKFDMPVKDAVDADGNIAYQFEALNSQQSNKVTEAEFELVLELDENSYQNLITAGNVKLSFTNQASLKEEGTGDPVAVSESVPTKMEMSFIGKQGKEANLEGTRYAWIIDLKTKLPIMKRGYGFLVDTICQTDHSYDMEHGIEITAEGLEAQVLKPELKEVRSPVKWEDLTADNLHNMMVENGIAGPFYYVYDVTDENGDRIANPFYGQGSDTSEYVQRAVLVIPYDDYKGPKEDGTSRAVTIKYLTDLNQHGLDSKTYLEILAAHPEYAQEIKNQVNLLWENEGGVGPGPVPQDEVDFGKRVDTNIDAVYKEGAKYDPATKMAEWSVDVNKLGISLQNAVLTDALGKGVYDTNKIKITYYRYYNQNHDADESGTMEQLAGDPNESQLNSAFGYTLDAEDTLRIYLGDLAGSDDTGYIFYKLSIQMPVQDETILANQSKDQSVSNEISLSAVHAGTPYQGSSKADLTMPNTLIEKSAEGTYDYKTHELQWSVTVNPEKVNIRNGKVIDTMEDGFSFGKLTAVEKNGTADSRMYDKLKDTKASGQTIEWNMEDIGENTYTLHFTTVASEDWRNTNLICPTDGNGELLTGSSVEVPNNVELTGLVNGTRQITNAKADAAQTIDKMPLTKKGVLNDETGEIKWTIMANQDQYNISGMYLTETLTSVHELDPDSVKAYVIGDTETEETKGQLKDESSSGFTYIFPDNGGANYQTYKLTFSTYLTEEAEASDASISNQVYLKNGDGSYEEVSKPDNGGFNGGFDFGNAAKASKRPKIALRKISSNSTDETGGESSLGLSVEFSLKGYAYSYNNKTLSVDMSKPISKYDKTRTVTEGDASFLNINPSDDIIYVLTEGKALEGYDPATAEPYFLYFPRSEKTSVGEVDSVSFAGKNYNKYKRIEPSSYADGGVPETVTVTNTPLNSDFAFTKLQVRQDNYQDNGQQVKDYETAKDVVFKVEPQGNLAGKIKTRYVTSGINGQIQLKELDPGQYKLTEVKSNDNIMSGGTVMLQVKFTEGTGYTCTFSNAKNGISIDQNNNAILKDELLTGNFSFKKYVQYGNKEKEALSGIEFYLEGKTIDSASDNNVKTGAKSGADGKVQFNNIPVGSYKVYEIPAKGYAEYIENVQPIHVYDIEVTEKETNTILGENENISYKGKKSEVSVAVIRTGGSSTDTKAEICNTAIKGTVSLTKVLDEDILTALNGQAVEGAQFGLYRTIGGKTGDKPVYTAAADGSGNLTFTDVEYGNYLLKEIKAPDGYDNGQLAEAVTITREMLADAFEPQDKPTAFNYQNADPAVNKLYKVNIPFVKRDRDGNAITDVTFSLYRRNETAISEDGSGLTAKVNDDVHDYWAYNPMPSMITDKDGTFALNGLPYGDYLMVETGAPEDLQDGHHLEAIHISVTDKKIVVTENENFEKTAEGDCYKNVDPAECGNWMAVEKEGDNFRIINQKKYGFVQLYKTAGERAGDQVTADTETRLQGAEFEITKGGEHYLTLKTDEYGRITPVTSGGYAGYYKDLTTGAYRHLFYGTYQIQETKAPDGYKVNSTPVEFVISDDTTGHEGNAWIALNEDTSNVTYTKSGDRQPEIEKAAVVNERQRAGFTIQKTGADDLTALKSGAVFEVYSSNKLVGTLKESSTAAGTYEIKNEDADGNPLDTVNDAKVPYLHDSGNGYTILPGTYTVKEVKAPAGYEVTSFTITITEKADQSGTDIAVSGNDRAELNGTTVTLRDDPIVITISKTDLEGRELTGAQFTVSGKFADGTNEKTFEEAASGQIIAGEKYILQEMRAPDTYILSGEKIEFTADENGMLTIADGKNTASVDAGQKDKMIFKDSPIDITLKKIDGFDQKTVIGDVKFELYDITGQEFRIGTFTTVQDGTVKLTGIIGGHMYRLAEAYVPAHYVAGQEVTFKVLEDGTLSEITGAAGADDKKTTLTVENKPVNASVRLKKLDSFDGSGIGETVFRLTKDGQPSGEYTTVSNKTEADHITGENKTEKISLEKGELFITGLEKGSYKLEEITANSNYELGAEAFSCEFTVDDSWGSGRILNVNSNEAGITNVTGSWNDKGVLNERKTGSVSLVKKGQPDGADQLVLLAGAEFTLYDADGKEIQKVTTDENGVAKIEGLAWNGYYLKETKAPDGYAVNEEKLEFTIGYGSLSKGFSQTSGGSDIVNKATVFTIEKTDMSGDQLTGAEFELYGLFSGADKEDTRTYSMADISSMTVYKELIGGQTYKLTEIKAPEGYELAEAVTITVAKNGEISVNGKSVKDNVIQIKDEKIKVSLRKTDLDGNIISGGIYTVAPAAGSKFARTDQMAVEVTEASMKEKLSGKLIAGNLYVLTEIKAPEGYELAKEVMFKVDEHGIVTLPGNPEFAAVDSKDTIVLKDRPVELNIVKLDEKKKELAGAEFKVEGRFAKLAGEADAPEAITVGQNESKKLTARLIAGESYTITEVTEPSGYIRLAGAVSFKVENDGTVTITANPENAAELTDVKDEIRITDRPTKFYIDKKSNEPDADGNDVRVKDAVLEIRNADGSPIDGRKWTSGGKNKGEMTHLPKGEYQLVETDTPYGYVTAGPVGFELHENNEITLTGAEGTLEKDSEGNYTIVMTDKVIRTQVQLTKSRINLDGETKTALSEAAFDLYRMVGSAPDQAQDTLIAENLRTNDQGVWTTVANDTVRVDNPDETLLKGLTEGSYYFQETEAPKDTWLDPANRIWTFDVKAETHDSTIKVDAENKAFRFEVTLKKVDQVSKEVLSGVEFTLMIQTAEDQWDVKETQKTNEEGLVTFGLYEKGIYRLTETAAIPGYKLSAAEAFTAEFTVTDDAYDQTLEIKEEITEEDQKIFNPTVQHVLYADGNIANERIPGILELSKEDEEDGTSLDGVTFSIYQKKEDGTYVKAGDFLTGSQYARETDGTWSSIASDAGKLRVEGLDWGEYYIQESKAQTGYILSDEKYEFGIGRFEQEVILSVDKGAITNARTKIYFYKSGRLMEDCVDGTLEGVPDADYSKRLAGSEFTAYTDPECQNAVNTAVSDGEGKVEFVRLPGDQTYYIKETKAAEGYLLNENVYKAVLDDHGQYQGFWSEDDKEVQDLTVVNDVKRTDIVMKKVSEQDSSVVISGAVYGLYKKADQIPAEGVQPLAAADSDEWRLIAKSTTDEKGMLTFAGVLMNTDYMIRELQAPDGSHISENPVVLKFGTDENGNPVITELADGSGTVKIDPETGEMIWLEPSIILEFAKKDEEGSLIEGAKLALVDEDGKTIEEWTSSKEKTHLIYGDQMEGKIVGGRTYKLVEKQAPDGYLMAEPVIFTVETKATGPDEGFIQTIEMVDKKIVPKPEPKPDPAKPDPVKPDPVKPDPVKPEQKPEGKDPQKPAGQPTAAGRTEKVKTGDQDHMALYVILMGMAAAVGTLAVRRKKKNS